MPHICAIPFDSSVLHALRQTHWKIGPQRERRGLERPRERRLAPESLAWKRRQACKQYHDEHDDQPSYQAENRPQRAIRGTQARRPDRRRKREPDDPADQEYRAKHDQEACQCTQQRTQALRQDACDLPSEKRRQYEPAHPHSQRDHLARQAVEQADRDRHDQDDQHAKIEPSHRCATCPTSSPSDLSLSRAFSAAPRLANGPARTRVCSPCSPLTFSVQLLTPADAARSCTCFALSGFVKAPSGTTNPSSFNSAWARRASAARGFAPSAVLTLSFFGARDRATDSDSDCGALFDGSFAVCVESAFRGATGGDCRGGRTRVLNGPPSWLGICTVRAWGTDLGCWSSTTGRTTTMSTTSAIAPISRRRARRLSRLASSANGKDPK